MTTLVFDTETSGFYDPKLNFDDPKQGRIIQLVCVLFNDEFNIVNSFYSLINPSGLSYINPGAQAAHGITLDILARYGNKTKTVIDIFNEFYDKADFKVAHNLRFDSQMLDVEMSLLGDGVHPWANNASCICTMKEMTNIVKLPGNGKFGQTYKWPKLQEAYYHCFSKNFDKAHDAMADVTATSKVFAWMIQNGHIVLPKELAA